LQQAPFFHVQNHERDQMKLTKDHKYTDGDGDTIRVEANGGGPEGTIYLAIDQVDGNEGAFITKADSVPLALNILGHDRPDDDPLATSFDVNGRFAHLADSKSDRHAQLDVAAALLMAVDAYDRRAVRRASAEERRNAAAMRLTDKVGELHNAGPGPFTGEEIGKLREALGNYDAALAN
jgi:hypothetical protein